MSYLNPAHLGYIKHQLSVKVKTVGTHHNNRVEVSFKFEMSVLGRTDDQVTYQQVN